MESTFGERLHAARKRAGFRTQETLAGVLGRSSRTVRNWETDKTVPNSADLAELRRVLGDFDAAHVDQVEAAVTASSLTEDRQHLVLATYKRLLREQATEGQDRLQRWYDDSPAV